MADEEIPRAQSSEPPSDEGDDIVDDSSEEAATDEEEAQKLRREFINDNEDEEDNPSDDEEERHRKRRKRRRKHGLSLDADDLALVEENTGTRMSSRNEFSRIRRGRAFPVEDFAPPAPVSSNRGLILPDLSDDESDHGGGDISRIFDDRTRITGRGGVTGAFDEMDLDDDEGFIDDDDDDEDGEMGEEEREQRRREKRRSEKQRRKAMDARPELAGIDSSAWDEIYDVFGNGDDYDWALDDDEEGSDPELTQKEMRYQDVFEPAEIAARFLTADDDVIRATDIPERMQLTTSSLSPQATLATNRFNDSLPSEELRTAAEWVAARLSNRIHDDFYLATGKYRAHWSDLIAAITSVLKYVLEVHLEVPYIWAHKRDYISIAHPHDVGDSDGPSSIILLDREDLWRVRALASRYQALYARKKLLMQTYERMAEIGRVSDQYFEFDIASALHSVESVTDAMEWLSMTYKKQYHDALETEDNDRVQRHKNPSRVTSYDLAKNSVISRLADTFFGIPIVDLVKNISEDQRRYITEDFDTSPLTYAEEFVTDSPGGPTTPEDALRVARMILSTELGKNPQLRQITRDRFKDGAVVTVKPTEKGLNKIDAQHPYNVFKYLQGKPVQNMLNDAQWLHILAAETDHLVAVSITLSTRAESSFRDALTRAFNSDGFSDVAQAWNYQRTQIIGEVIENHLYAVGVKYVREWLRDEVEERLATKCSQSLEHRIDVAPFRPTKEQERGDVPSVLALSWGKGDPQKDAIYAVLMDDGGHIREHLQFDNLMDPSTRSEFMELVTRRKPKVITVGGFTVLTLKLWERVREVLGYKDNEDSSGPATFRSEDQVPADGHNGPAPPSRSRGIPPSDPNLVPVIWVPDHVARIFQHSKRAAEEFGSLPEIGRYCAGLARYIQSPLNEYAALGADITAISFHEDQQLLSHDKLLSALERSLVNVVNDVGVDINKVIGDPYYRHLLPFVSGLGPRKAQAMLKRIAQMGGNVLNREQFVTGGLMTAQIFINAAGFLRITQDDYEDGGLDRGYATNRRQDPLDATRIHPEDYDLARKMAMGALELDEEDFINQHPSAPVSHLINEENSARLLSSLGLDEFAQSLLETQNERKRHTLDLIHDELLTPFGERRPDFEPMTDWEVISMLTGETRRTLVPGRVVTTTISRIRPMQVDVRLDSGLEGAINKELLTTNQAEPKDVVKLRQSIQAVIISVDMSFGPQLRITMASRADAIEQADTEPRQRLDEYYDHSAARQAQELAERKLRNEANQSRRIVKHPDFKNFSSKEAENYLAPLQHGEAVIRPGSKGPDHLAVTWKVADGVYQHIDVREPNADQPISESNKFFVDEKHSYSDLDDLLVNHVKAMSRKVDDLMASEKYKGGSDQDLHNWLTNFVKMNPNRSSYAFGLNRSRAGYFNLSFLANINSPVQTWQVKVTPTSYKLGEMEVGSVPDLCDAFKRKHQKDLRTIANGGKTPYGAGRATPGRLTNAVASGYGTNYGKTPNPYQPPPRTPAWGASGLAVGKTPNPYQHQPQPLPPVIHGIPMAPPLGYSAVPAFAPNATPLRPAPDSGPPPGIHPDRWKQMQAQ